MTFSQIGECLSCSIVAGKIESLGGMIAETPFFHAHQDYAYPILGCVIVASKRHFKALDDMAEQEGSDFILFVRRIRAAQRIVLGIEHVYIFYNEDTRHHFHLWMVPRYAWMEEFGKSVESLRPAMLHARQHMSSEAHVAEVSDTALRLRRFLEHGS